MAEEALHDANVNASFEQPSCRRVAKHVGRHGGCEPSAGACGMESLTDARRRQAVSMAVEQEPIMTSNALLTHRQVGAKKPIEPGTGDVDRAVAESFAKDADAPSAEVSAPEGDGAGLSYPCACREHEADGDQRRGVNRTRLDIGRQVARAEDCRTQVPVKQGNVALLSDARKGSPAASLEPSQIPRRDWADITADEPTVKTTEGRESAVYRALRHPGLSLTVGEGMEAIGRKIVDGSLLTYVFEPPSQVRAIGADRVG